MQAMCVEPGNGLKVLLFVWVMVALESKDGGKFRFVRIGRLVTGKADVYGDNKVAMVFGVRRKRQGSGRMCSLLQRRTEGQRSWAATMPVQAHKGLITNGANSNDYLTIIKEIHYESIFDWTPVFDFNTEL